MGGGCFLGDLEIAHDVSRFFWGPAKATVDRADRPTDHQRLSSSAARYLSASSIHPAAAAEGACGNPDISLSRIPFSGIMEENGNLLVCLSLLHARLPAYLVICMHTGDNKTK